MVTKKRRRSQLARAGRLRQEARRSERERRRRRRRTATVAVVVVLLVVGLVVWIATHRPGSAAARALGSDYASVVHLPAPALTRVSADTPEEAR